MSDPKNPSATHEEALFKSKIQFEDAPCVVIHVDFRAKPPKAAIKPEAETLGWDELNNVR